MAIHGDPVGVGLPTGGTLHLEGVEVRRVFCVARFEICHAVGVGDQLYQGVRE